MSLQQTIEQKLGNGFTAEHLNVENESHKHSVPPNSETHFKVTLVAPEFEGMAKVRRHQAVYQALAKEMDDGLHALALHLYTPGEWAASGQDAPQSPNCMGGSKPAADSRGNSQ